MLGITGGFYPENFTGSSQKAGSRAESEACEPILTVTPPGGGTPITGSLAQLNWEINNPAQGDWTYEVYNPCSTAINGNVQTSVKGWGGISGVVVDAATGKPIENATLLTTAGVIAYTDSSGVFVTTHPAGNFTLGVGKNGYVTTQQPLTIAENGMAEANIAMAAEKCLFKKLLPANSRHLQALRRFRDEVLTQSAAGRLAIQTYYGLSPLAADLIEDNAYLQGKVRALADRLVPYLQE